MSNKPAAPTPAQQPRPGYGQDGAIVPSMVRPAPAPVTPPAAPTDKK